MLFGPVPLDDALGCILAHTVRFSGGAGAIAKGRVLTAEDLDALRAAGLATVVVARLEDGDIGEDEAAAAAAAALGGRHVAPGDAFTGRTNLRSTCHGLLVVDTAAVDRLNGIDESLTVATQVPYTAVTAGALVATVKVIPFAVPARAVDQWVALCQAGRPAIEVAPFVPQRVGLLATTLAGTSESVLGRAIETVITRVARLGSRVERLSRSEHDSTAVTTALHELVAGGMDLILVMSASATVDRRDVIPVAIEQAGGKVEYFGLPIDPGNLLSLGRVGDTTVIGVPGCARSPKPSGFDRILERRLAMLPLDREVVSRMGTGGLMKEIPSRPLPRAGTAAHPDMPSSRVGAVVLAAGRSTRMGQANKLLADVRGSPMIRQVVAALPHARLDSIMVVIGHDAPRVEAALAGLPIQIVRNPAYGRGLSTSLRAGLLAIEPDLDGVLVVLGDMPWVSSATIDALLDAFQADAPEAICVPVYRRKRGNPVLWPARYVEDMKSLTGDVGARHLLAQLEDEVWEVAVDDPGVLRDVDRLGDLPGGP